MIHELITQFGKFGVVGVTATATYFTLVVVLVEWFAVAPLPANALAYCVAFLVSWLGNSRWTFRGNTRRGAILRFISVGLLGLTLNQGINALIIYVLGGHYLLGLVVVVMVVPIITFTLNRLWVFVRV